MTSASQVLLISVCCVSKWHFFQIDFDQEDKRFIHIFEIKFKNSHVQMRNWSRYRRSCSISRQHGFQPESRKPESTYRQSSFLIGKSSVGHLRLPEKAKYSVISLKMEVKDRKRPVWFQLKCAMPNMKTDDYVVWLGVWCSSTHASYRLKPDGRSVSLDISCQTMRGTCKINQSCDISLLGPRVCFVSSQFDMIYIELNLHMVKYPRYKNSLDLGYRWTLMEYSGGKLLGMNMNR